MKKKKKLKGGRDVESKEVGNVKKGNKNYLEIALVLPGRGDTELYSLPDFCCYFLKNFMFQLISFLSRI